MKKYLPYLLLFTYLTTLLKPVIPYIMDGFAHILYFDDHMTIVHAHNGNYHVHSEVAEETKKETGQKSTENSTKKAAGFTDAIISGKTDFKRQWLNTLYYIEFTTNIESICLAGNYPPPKL